ncbi:MAG: TlpA disulfide reductase family protein [Gammaproteobacteria bacterium]|nr:TlpA disulfide reductase family protein [Gammaproteobacteria bacterium]
MRLLIFIMALFVTLPVVAEKVDFTLLDLDGKSVSLSDFRGKWVIVNYWATWCPPCLEEIPDLVELYEENRDTIVVLGIDFEEVNRDYLKEFVDSHMMSYPVMNAAPEPVTELGPVLGLPTSYIISPQGERVARQEGPVTREAIEKYIARKQQEGVGMEPVTQSSGASGQ